MEPDSDSDSTGLSHFFAFLKSHAPLFFSLFSSHVKTTPTLAGPGEMSKERDKV